MRKAWFILAAPAWFTIASCTTTSRDTAHTFSTVVVDAGHGGKDSGTARRSGPPEKTVALDVAQRLARKLHESELKTIMTRSDDTFIPLDTRVAIGNRTPNSLFVSIHFNDSRRAGVKGFETYYRSPYALALAQRIERQLSTIPGSVNRGVRTANFRVLRNAAYPSVLVECGYLSNRAEGQEARSNEYRELLADKIAEAIVEERYGSGSYRPRPSSATTAATTPFPPGEAPAPRATPPADTGPFLVPEKLGSSRP